MYYLSPWINILNCLSSIAMVKNKKIFYAFVEHCSIFFLSSSAVIKRKSLFIFYSFVALALYLYIIRRCRANRFYNGTGLIWWSPATSPQRPIFWNPPCTRVKWNTPLPLLYIVFFIIVFILRSKIYFGIPVTSNRRKRQMNRKDLNVRFNAPGSAGVSVYA